MRDPAADEGCRAWPGPCERCQIDYVHGCFMLGYSLGRLWLQCPVCDHRFWWATGFGVGGAPERAGMEWP